MLVTGELQTRAPQLDDPELVRLFKRKVAGEPFPHSFIHEANPYSAAPADLVRGRDHAPGTDHGDGRATTWYFCWPANYLKSAGGGGSTGKQSRKVVGAGQTYWHTEGSTDEILGPDKKPVGASKRTLTYKQKIKNPSAKGFKRKTLGWLMVEILLDQYPEDPNRADQQQLVFYKLYRSPRTDPETSTETRSAGAEAAANGVSEAEDSAREGRAGLEVPGGDMPCPVAREPAPALPIGSTPEHGILCRPGRKIQIAASRVAIVKKADAAAVTAATVVMKLGGSSIPSAERMMEMAKLAGAPGIRAAVLSGMGNTDDNILLAVWKALRCDHQTVSEIKEFAIIKELYLRTSQELGLDTSTVSDKLDMIQRHLQYVCTTKDLTPTTLDYLVSFGERTSTEMFYQYLNKPGKAALQEWELHPITTSGRGSSDLTAATIGRALGSKEIQVWKDEYGICTCDPKICANAIPVPYLTFDEAAGIRYFDEKTIQQVTEDCMLVRVKNSYDPQAPGTMIIEGDMSMCTLTIIVLKSNITMLDIKSKRMLDQNDFVIKAISIFNFFEYLGITVYWVATSEGKMSFTLVPSKLLCQELIQPALDNAVEELKKIAAVDRVQGISVISLLGNAGMSTPILETALFILRGNNFVVKKVLEGSSEATRCSLVVDGSDAEDCVRALHSAFFGNGLVSKVQGEENQCPIPENSSVAASYGIKRKADAPPPGGDQEWTTEMDPNVEFVQGASVVHDDDPEDIDWDFLCGQEMMETLCQEMMDTIYIGINTNNAGRTIIYTNLNLEGGGRPKERLSKLVRNIVMYSQLTVSIEIIYL